MGLTGLGAMWANTNSRFDALEQRVAGLELDRQQQRESMAQVLNAIQRTDRRLALWICSQDPKRCAE
jgi:septal ring factor EnvC (AmiA/AmiB activator)